jgi:hypothetical protein
MTQLSKKDIVMICRWHGWLCKIEDDYDSVSGRGLVRTPYVFVWKQGYYAEKLGRKWDVEMKTMPEIIVKLNQIVLQPLPHSEESNP